MKAPFYELKPLKLGAEVIGADLTIDCPSKELIHKLVADVQKHRLLIFRDQHQVTPERQLQIAQWFGPIQVDDLPEHKKSPYRGISRISNAKSEGIFQTLSHQWHVDRAYARCPASTAVYFMVNVANDGDTVFVGLTDVIESLPKAQRNNWERLWFKSDHPDSPAHPLIYKHPLSGTPTMCFHNGRTECFIYDYESKSERLTGAAETEELLREIEAAIEVDRGRLTYSHKWREGDLVISDNLALAHRASEDAARPVDEIGLRVLHEVNVAGTYQPKTSCDLAYSFTIL